MKNISIRASRIIVLATRRMIAAIASDRKSIELCKLRRKEDYHFPLFIVSLFPCFLSKELREVRKHFIKKGCVVIIRKIHKSPVMIATWR